MLYLILPPVIIILSFGLLLWYLSRKSHDPLVAERVSAMASSGAGQGTVRFPQARVFFLRLLEKLAHSFKVSTLKSHNRMHNWLQSIKESRKRVQAMKEQSDSSRDEEAAAMPVAEKKRRFFGSLGRRSREAVVSETAAVPERQNEAVTDADLEAPFKRRKTFFGNSSDLPPQGPAEPAAKPQPKAPPAPAAEPVRRAEFSEEDLISQIATNPKDFKAYEALGDYYMESGNVKDAKECYRQVLKLRPAERLVKIKIRRLEKMLSTR